MSTTTTATRPASWDWTPSTPVGVATRTTQARARRAYLAGGEVAVAESGHRDTWPVFGSTTTHRGGDADTWRELVDMVDMWRNRWPGQTYYLVTRDA